VWKIPRNEAHTLITVFLAPRLFSKGTELQQSVL
jgi:hypothetical protein